MGSITPDGENQSEESSHRGASVASGRSAIISEDHSASNLSRGGRLIQTKDFGFLWWGQTTSQIGEGLNKVALLWFVYELTESAMQMTMVGFLQTIPPLLLVRGAILSALHSG